VISIEENCIDLTGDKLPILPTPSSSSRKSNPKKSELNK